MSTLAVYPLGTPPSAGARGGDCRAVDLSQGRNVVGPHFFDAPDDARISNGLVRATVGAASTVPSLLVEAYRGEVTLGDAYGDVYSDTYSGSIAVPSWIPLGSVIVDSPSASALLSEVRLVRVSPEAVVLRLVSAAIGDAFVTLRRGARVLEVQHGSKWPASVNVERRVWWSDAPAPEGAASSGRVEELFPVDGLWRFVASREPVNTSVPSFAVVAPAAPVATFGAGFSVDAPGDRTADHHGQMADRSRLYEELIEVPDVLPAPPEGYLGEGFEGGF